MVPWALGPGLDQGHGPRAQGGQGHDVTLCKVSIGFLILSLFLGAESYQIINNFLKSFFGKFLIIGLCWTFSFHILNELRHLIWDLGYGFDLKVARITGVIALIGSFILTILFYLIGKNIF